MSAKQNYDKLVSTNQTMMETTKQECEYKMSILQSCRITFSTGWLIFWWFFGFGIGFLICLVVGFSNKSSRSEYKNQELMRLQMKINNFANLEVSQQSFQQINKNQMNNQNQ